MTHTCHAPGCTKIVVPRLFACRLHWFSLRQPIRDALLREYREGQEIDKRPSARYMAVAQRAAAELAFKPNDEEAARVSAGHLVESEAWRMRAIYSGYGDPLYEIDKRRAVA